MTDLEAARWAQMFHETYERLAPEFGYKTREASAVPWEDVPENNKALMIAVANEVIAAACADAESQVADAVGWDKADAPVNWRSAMIKIREGANAEARIEVLKAVLHETLEYAIAVERVATPAVLTRGAKLPSNAKMIGENARAAMADPPEQY